MVADQLAELQMVFFRNCSGRRWIAGADLEILPIASGRAAHSSASAQYGHGRNLNQRVFAQEPGNKDPCRGRVRCLEELSAHCGCALVVLGRGEKVVRLHDVVARATNRVEKLLELPEDLARLLDYVARCGNFAVVICAGRTRQPDHVADAQRRYVGILWGPGLSACDGLAEV